MKVQYHKMYSPALNRDMELKSFGHAGKPCIVFAPQDGRFFDFENFGMIPPCQRFIDEGQLKLYCVDSIDQESWSNRSGDPHARLEMQERWFSYIVNEFYPFMMQDSGWEGRAMTLGCSMGATHAANALFRRPDLFDSVIALSGCYDTKEFFGDYQDALTYLNSPIDSVRGMPIDHPYIDQLNSCKIIICAGQGAWEGPLLNSSLELKHAMEEKGIHGWVDVWGYDVNHDWPWWRIQLPYFLEKIL